MDIVNIYERMRELGLATSQMQFSEIWLGRSPRYYSHLISVRHEPGVATLIALSNRLENIGIALNSARGQFLRELACGINELCKRRVVTDIRKRRPLSE